MGKSLNVYKQTTHNFTQYCEIFAKMFCQVLLYITHGPKIFFFIKKNFHFRVKIAEQMYAHKRLWCQRYKARAYKYFCIFIFHSKSPQRLLSYHNFPQLLSISNLLLYTVHQILNETHYGATNMQNEFAPPIPFQVASLKFKLKVGKMGFTR